MKKIKSALISVSDKSNLKPLLQVLKKNKINLISSGGTFKKIQKLKFKCSEVSDFTGFNEILDGRVKTLHPKIHAGILNKRNNKSILIQLENEGWKFTCDNFNINIDNGLYFGNKNSYTNNQNIFISGISNNKIENIEWKIKKIY